MTEKQANEALSKVIEPDLGGDLVSLHMIRDLAVKGDRGTLTIVLTTPACPYKSDLENGVREQLTRAGAKQVVVHFAAEVPPARPVADKVAIPGVKNMIAVASGKGGVGKT